MIVFTQIGSEAYQGTFSQKYDDKLSPNPALPFRSYLSAEVNNIWYSVVRRSKSKDDAPSLEEMQKALIGNIPR